MAKNAILIFCLSFLTCYGQNVRTKYEQEPKTFGEWGKLHSAGNLIRPNIPFPDSLFEKEMGAWVQVTIIIKNPGIIDSCFVGQINIWPKGTKNKGGEKIYSNVYGRQLMQRSDLGDSIVQRIIPWLNTYRKALKFIPNPSYYTANKNERWVSYGINFYIRLKQMRK